MFATRLARVGVVCVLALAATANAWQNVCEDGDAGDLPDGAQDVSGGIGMISGISGRLNGLSPAGGDFQDMYRLFIRDPAVFSARVQGVGFHAQLWLFEGPGHSGCQQVEGGGLLATSGEPGSAGILVMRSGEAEPTVVFEPGFYYLAVTGVGTDLGNPMSPVSAAGDGLFDFDDEAISGPDGDGGSEPLATWQGVGATGDYYIPVEGLIFGPPSCTADLDDDGVVGFADLLQILASWGPCPGCTADIDGDGDVGFGELLTVLASWGPCPDPPGACCLCDGTCVELSAEDCAIANGDGQGPGALCSSAPCAGAVGACCFSDGTCLHLTESACADSAGSVGWSGGGVACAPDDPCAGPSTGACCAVTDMCVGDGPVTPEECAAINGFFAGLGTTCDVAGPCLGACCMEDGMCMELTLPDCIGKFEGRYLGPGLPCAPPTDPCACVSVGACCSGGSVCDDIPERFCAALDRVYLGDGTSCSEDQGVQCTGACCLPNGMCFDDIGPLGCFDGVEYGVWAGPGTACPIDGCPIVSVGSCCFVATVDTCEETTEVHCAFLDGRYLGDGTECLFVACIGACCQSDGTCSPMHQVLCLESGGVYLGDGIECEPNPCAGSCCLPAGCEVLGLEDCTQMGGSWGGYCSNCSPDPCPLPTGGCCFPLGGCTIETVATCEATGGIYRGDDTGCLPNPCSGVCCLLDGSCQETTDLECSDLGGEFRGGGFTCDQGQCVGACCFGDDSCEPTTFADCESGGGTWGGLNTVCFIAPCPLGACCLPDDSCVVLSALSCLLVEGLWAGADVLCSEVSCPLPSGACCFDFDGCAVVTPQQCDFLDGVYQGDDTPCDPTPCIGACCFPGPNCIESNEQFCSDQGGAFQGVGTTCTPDPCP